MNNPNRLDCPELNTTDSVLMLRTVQRLYHASEKLGRLLICGGPAGALYTWRNHRSGLDLSIVHLTQTGLSADRANFHRATGGPHLARVIQRLRIPRESRILDLGSGKGGALLTFCQFPFEEVAGVELSEDLLLVCEKNLRRSGARNVRLYHMDAAQFTDLDKFNFIYLYNPFPEAIVAKVVENVENSLRRVPRDLKIIYVHPVCHAIFQASQMLRLEHQYKVQASYYAWVFHDCYVYSSVR